MQKPKFHFLDTVSAGLQQGACRLYPGQHKLLQNGNRLPFLVCPGATGLSLLALFLQSHEKELRQAVPSLALQPHTGCGICP